MIVIDASVLTDALTDDSLTGKAAYAAVSTDDAWAGPEHLLVETAAAIRGRWLGRKLSEPRAEAALRFLVRAQIDKVDTALLLPRIWELRPNLTSYDAAYVAAAEALDVPLVTSDVRLENAPGIRCSVRMVTTSG